MAHERPVFAWSFSPDGSRLLTVSEDQAARLWDADTGELVALPMRHHAPISTAAFNGDGTLIVHLGMSGRLWLVSAGTPPATHDHFDLTLANGRIVRLRDPRRFGLVLWHKGDPLTHKLLRDIGPEPLSTALSAEWLYRETRSRSGAPTRTLGPRLTPASSFMNSAAACLIRASWIGLV